MLNAVEGATMYGPLRDAVKAFIDAGVPVQVVYLDLDQIRGLLPEHEEDIVLDVMDLVAGDCHPDARIGHHQWGDPENPIARLDASGFERE